MKIGILTFHRAHNYGAVLQAFALVTYLRSRGYDAEVVDYRPQAIEDAHGMFPVGRLNRMSLKRRIYWMIKSLPFLFYRKKRADKFYEFIRTLPTSSKIYTENCTEIKGYDYLICGSDQIWNKKILNGFDKFYTGQIKTDAKFISYAASTTINDIEEIYEYSCFLSNFKRITVREAKLKDLLSSISPIPVIQVLDPVFLLTKLQWVKFSKNIVKEDRYILVYQVKRHPSVMKYAKELATYNDCKVIEITAEADFVPYSYRYTTLSPQEFVGAFVNARCVVTTSFHGTAFAALFKIPMKVMLFNTPGDERAMDLLNTLGLQNCSVLPNSSGKIKLPVTTLEYSEDVIEHSKSALIF